MLIKDIMMKNPITLSEEEYVEDVLKKIEKFNIDSFPVVNRNNSPVGIFESKIIFLKKENYEGKLIKEVMRPMEGIRIVKEFEEASIIFNRPKELFFVVDEIGKYKSILRKRHVMKIYFEKLEYNESNLDAVLKSIDSAIFGVNRQGNVVFMNDKAEDVLEMDKNFAKGKNITEIIPNSEMPNILEKGEITFSKTFDYKNKKLLVNRIPLKRNDRIIGAVCSFRDISDYSNIKEQLTSEKTEKEILKTIFEIAYDGLVVIDPEGYITMMSNAYKKFLGFENEEVIGRHVADVIENTRLHIVANTGVAEIADLQKVNEGYMIASRIPVFENGNVACVVGKVMFRNIGELDDIYSKINKIEQELEDYKDELTQINKARYNFSNIVGGSKEIKEVISLAKKAAYTNSSVLILGESGTGKELFAHSIHNSSARRNKPFIKVNCAAIPNELLESELFGYEQGAFTGAKKGGKIGKFEVADQGTIFLDEIADMPFHMQAKILRVIQEREIERIGSNTPKRIDVRIIAATNRNIEKMIDENKFRLDLYYRLNVVTLDIPALRERIGDVEELCKNFIEKYRVRYLKKVDGINENALLKLRRYNWPGNIRELENMIERAINIMDEDTVIKPKHLPLDVSERYDPEEIKTLKETVEEAEKRAIVTALDSVKGNKSKASKILGISRTALYEKIERYKLGSVM